MRRPEEPTLSELEFVGCTPVPMTWQELRRFDGRLEAWDAKARTAWMVSEPTSPAHESPSQGLAGLVESIGAVRGASIKCFGAMDLLMRDEFGKPRRVVQADQTVYLYPARAELLGSSAMVAGRHNYPDVVLEVDHTTDVRRGKLRLYEAWGFPEVWVEVLDQRTPKRPRGRLPGLTIHLLEGGMYRELPASRAFPGWRATAIHEAMNEVEPSGWTHARLKYLGRTLGARDGTGPDDDPLLRSLRNQSRAEGERRCREGGLAEGERKGREKGLAEGERKGREKGLAEGERRGREKGLAEGERGAGRRGWQRGCERAGGHFGQAGAPDAALPRGGGFGTSLRRPGVRRVVRGSGVRCGVHLLVRGRAPCRTAAGEGRAPRTIRVADTGPSPQRSRRRAPVRRSSTLGAAEARTAVPPMRTARGPPPSVGQGPLP